MSTRNPMNKRSQAKVQGEMKGMARKSASSAKPARAAASSVRVVASSGKAKRQQLERGESLAGLSREEKKARKQERRMQEDRIYTAATELMKENDDYNRLRRIFWIILGSAFAILVLAWVILSALAQQGVIDPVLAGSIQMIATIAVYVIVIISFIFDFVKVRPIRNECRAVAEGMSDTKLAAVIERAAAREAERSSRKGKKEKAADK